VNSANATSGSRCSPTSTGAIAMPAPAVPAVRGKGASAARKAEQQHRRGQHHLDGLENDHQASFPNQRELDSQYRSGSRALLMMAANGAQPRSVPAAYWKRVVLL
jgi:hypothetical protein